MSKVTLARVTIGAAFTIAAAVALFILWWVGVFLVWWASSEIISFSIIIGLIVLAGLVVGGGFAVDWAMTVISKAKEEEAEEERRSAEDKKMSAYVDKWGEGAVPPRVGSSRLPDYTLPPVSKTRGANIG